MEMRSPAVWGSCGRQGGEGTGAIGVLSISEDRAETEGTTLCSGPLAPEVLELMLCVDLAICVQAEPDGQLNFCWERTGCKIKLISEVAEMQPVWKALLYVLFYRRLGGAWKGFKGLSHLAQKAP